MRGLISVMLAVLSSAIFVGQAQALTSIGGSLNEDFPKLDSSVYLNGQGFNGNFMLSLDPQKASLDNACWSFYRDYWEPSQWRAICSMSGYRDSGELCPQSLSWNQGKSANGVNANSSIYFSVKKYSEKADPVMYVNGSFNLAPALVDNSNFYYYEFDQNYWQWDPLSGEGVEITRPAWRTEYQLCGRFVADSLEGARAMGMQFPAAPVPEPGTWALLMTSALAAGALFIKRRW